MGLLAEKWRIKQFLRLPPRAAAECRRDVFSGLGRDPGPERAMDEGVAWLLRAQDHSTTRDGGVARHYSLEHGWSASYPETTGYIVPTVLEHARSRGDESARGRAARMLDWLVAIQKADGSYKGGMIDQTPTGSVTFDTGQILLGLAAGVAEFGQSYRAAMLAAADWLVETQHPDGSWRNHAAHEPGFTSPDGRTYETHVAWGLFEAAALAPGRRYAEAAAANVRWSLTHQHANGWVDHCCIVDDRRPLTHTLGYWLRGVVEAHRHTGDPELLERARRTADGLLGALRPGGLLPGRLGPDWRRAAASTCLTGSAQVAICWLLLYRFTGDARYRDAAFAVNRYVRRTVDVDGPPETRGAVKGSMPVFGGYCPYQYPNWACKFLVDSLRLELEVRLEEGRPWA